MPKAIFTVAALSLAAVAAADGEGPGQLIFRPVANRSLDHATPPVPVPAKALRVYVFEGEASGAWVCPNAIAVEYARSGVLFDRKSGRVLRRLTVVDGWPEVRPAEFPAKSKRGKYWGHLVGPGVLDSYAPVGPPMPREAEPPTHLASGPTATFGGRTWEAMQPLMFLQSLRTRPGGRGDMNRTFGTWTDILKEANHWSYVQSRPTAGGEPVRYTMRQGLPSNLVTHLAASQGKLWAACVDIYDPQAGEWGPGGLACYDPKADRWTHVATIAGRPVRWVTLLQAVGEDLWIGFREGKGVAGDSVTYGKGLYPQQYRPVTTAIVLGRLSKGKWSTFSRTPMESFAGEGADGRAEPPGETPRTLAAVGGTAFLFSQSQARARGNWDVEWAGRVSALDTATGRWRLFEPAGDMAASDVRRMVAGDAEVLALTDRGVRRWVDGAGGWRAMDPGGDLKNPNVTAAAGVGGQLWIGYGRLSYDVTGELGISRFDEETMSWSHMGGKQIGTACPTLEIVPVGGGEVLALFSEHTYGGQPQMAWKAREPMGPAGLGRFKDGRWTFPVALKGVPEHQVHVTDGPNGVQTQVETLSIMGLARAGGRTYVSNRQGIYEGPGEWRLVMEFQPHREHRIWTSADGKTLQIWHDRKRWTYDPAKGKVEEITPPSGEPDMGFWPHSRPPAGMNQAWVEMPTRLAGSWALGQLDGSEHRVVETPRAVWLVSTGQLIRLDRKAMPGVLGP